MYDEKTVRNAIEFAVSLGIDRGLQMAGEIASARHEGRALVIEDRDVARIYLHSSSEGVDG